MSPAKCLLFPDVSQYSIRKSKTLLGLVGPEAEQKIVSSLDSSLNEWVDSVPDHRASRDDILLDLPNIDTSPMGSQA
jgi:hypothetical protein